MPSNAPIPNPPMISQAFADRARAYAGAAKAPTTLAVYAGDFSRFSAWCAEQGLPPLPATPSAVAAYLAWLADEGLKPVTIERALASIGHAHREAGAAWDRRAKEVLAVLQGIRRQRGVAPDRKAPVMDADLRALVATLGDDVRGKRDRAMLTLGWFGALRRSELVALDVSDVDAAPAGLLVTIRKSKTDGVGASNVIGVPAARDAGVCPVRAVAGWLEASALEDGPLFRRVARNVVAGRGGLTPSAVMRVVKRAADAAGLDPTKLAGHSLRAGFVTSAAAKGKSLEAIMRQSRHRSERVARSYIRPVTVFADNAADGLA